MSATMPSIDVDRLALSEEDKAIVRRIVARGRLRASAPPTRPCTVESGLAYYVWRMAAFSVSPNSQHWCMPVTADMYFPRPGYEWGSPERKAILERGDRIEKAIVSSVPVNQWYGMRKWGNVYGLIGRPQVTEDGSIVYR